MSNNSPGIIIARVKFSTVFLLERLLRNDYKGIELRISTKPNRPSRDGNINTLDVMSFPKITMLVHLDNIYLK